MVRRRVGAGGWQGVLECCVIAALVSELAAAGTQEAAGQQTGWGRDSEQGASTSSTRWELRGVATSSARPGLIGREDATSHPSSRRSLSETNEATTPCKGVLQGSPEADKCCTGLGDDEVACRKAKGICSGLSLLRCLL